MELQALLVKLLGPIRKKTSDELIFDTPFIAHHKPVLWVNLVKNTWHCWVTNRGGHIHQLISLLDKSASIPSLPHEKITPQQYVQRLENLKSKHTQIPPVILPQADSVFEHREVLQYLTSRGITHRDIIDYGMLARPRSVIIPSYDHKGNPNMWVQRAIDGGYYIPDMEKSSVIFFESRIDWNLPIVLVEGVFDAISVKYNAIPLLGKTLSPKSTTFQRIVASANSKIYVMLDPDAQDFARSLVTQLSQYGKEAYWVKLSGESDPGDLTTSQIWEAINSTQKVTFRSLFEHLI